MDPDLRNGHEFKSRSFSLFFFLDIINLSNEVGPELTIENGEEKRRNRHLIMNFAQCNFPRQKIGNNQ